MGNQPKLIRCEGDEWLHIYAQPFNHMEARIVGTREGLQSLHKAISAALAGDDDTCYGAMANDGEGYWIEVKAVTAAEFAEMPLPYTDSV